MKIKKKQNVAQASTKVKGGAKPKANAFKKTGLTLFLTLCAACMIGLVLMLSRKTQAVVYVAMSNKTLYKNEQITNPDEQLRRYPMLQGEYEKYTVVSDNGTETRRLIRWDERDELLGKYVANQIGNEKLIERSDFATSKVDNSNTALYSYPGKDIVKLTLGTSDLTAFKSFLAPGDKINIECTYTETVSFRDQLEENAEESGDWLNARDTVDQLYTVPVFQNIQIADILNSSGDSVLDMQAAYNELSLFQQAELDNDSTYQKKLQPSTLLLALTPQEKEIYYKYLSKSGATFRMSLPQRSE